MRVLNTLVPSICLVIVCLSQSVFSNEEAGKAAISGYKIEAEKLFAKARASEKNGKVLNASNYFLKSFLEYPHPTIMYEHIRLAYHAEQYQLVQNTGLKFLSTKPDISKRLSQNILDMVASSQELLQYELDLIDEEELNAPKNDGAKKPKAITPYRIHTNIFDIERSEKMVAHNSVSGAGSAVSNEVKIHEERQAKLFARHNEKITRIVTSMVKSKAGNDATNRYNVKTIAAKGDGHMVLSKNRNGQWQLKQESVLSVLRLDLLDDSNSNNKGKAHVFLVADSSRENVYSIDLKVNEIRHMNQKTQEKHIYEILAIE